MDEAVWRRKKSLALVFLIGLIVLGVGTFGAVVLFLVSTSGSYHSAAVVSLAPGVVVLIYALFHVAFAYLRIARPSVQSEGIVPRKWTAVDILRGRRIIPWVEILDLTVERHPRGPWWVTISLREDGLRFVTSDKGVPSNFPEVCENLARIRGTPVLHDGL